MEFQDFSVKGMKISRIGLGTWAIGGWLWGGTDEKEAINTIQSAVDMGINLIDTAPVYGFGHSEEVVGKALKERGLRDKAVIATKCGLNWDKDENVFRDCTEERLRQELEDSLRRLQTDHIDIYQIHWPDIKEPFANTAKLLASFVLEGKIRAIGVSNFSVEQMEEWRKYAPIHSIQPSYNIFESDMSRDIIPYALKNGISILGYSSLCRGLLSGKYTLDTKFNKGDMRDQDDPKFHGENFKKHLEAVEELKEIAAGLGKTVAQLAVRWVLDKGVTCALWGARNVKQLEAMPGAMDWKLTDEQMKKMESIVNKHVPVQVDKEFLTPPCRD
ncbi:MAG: aldo/keto reductase [Bacillota bacterium]|nr:aldo/keto reductase [Bacillota bacterium]